MQLNDHIHLAYCTNIHPAESWKETFTALQDHTLVVRDKVFAALAKDSCSQRATSDQAFAIGLRLSAQAASELNTGSNLYDFKCWLTQQNAYVYTINGFPYGAFHGTRVKENVYLPDWTSPARLSYTLELFNIIAELAPTHAGGSISTLPASFKEFNADENILFKNLYSCAEHIELLADLHQKDLHLGLEPEPLGHFENTSETLDFFARFHNWAIQNNLPTDLITRRIGVNYDTCHFALEFEDCHTSLDLFAAAGIRISKIHLSNALQIDLSAPNALDILKNFDEPTYLHQVITKSPTSETITRYRDLPEFFKSTAPTASAPLESLPTARVHFHIPLYHAPSQPLGSTSDHTIGALEYLKKNPHTCPHLEMETYTWAVLPDTLQLPIDDQLCREYLWTLEQWRKLP